MSRNNDDDAGLGRRGFLITAAGAVVAGGCAHGTKPKTTTPPTSQPTEAPGKEAEQGTATGKKIQQTRVLGRTGFAVSDISLGCGRISEANVIRYAYDHGINYFDTAERYSNGDSEKRIGEAMKHLDRSKIFITTKLGVTKDETAQSIIERYGKCLERMQTPYADALYMHSVTDVTLVKHVGFHAAVKQLKADNKLRHAGISSHGPRGKGDSMDKVLLAAIEDGRFDLMLLVYNFMNREKGERILTACKAKNVGATLMKTSPGILKMDPFNEQSPSPEHEKFIGMIMKSGKTREQAIVWFKKRYASRRKMIEDNRTVLDTFVKRHGITTQDALAQKSVQWVLNNRDAHTVCVSMPDFETLDKYLPLSGTTVSSRDEQVLEQIAAACSSDYCRHGCTDCVAHCPAALPVSTMMRYATYFQAQGREKHAMQKYAGLRQNAAACVDCDAPCSGRCPHGFDIRAGVLFAHGLLTLA